MVEEGEKSDPFTSSGRWGSAKAGGVMFVKNLASSSDSAALNSVGSSATVARILAPPGSPHFVPGLSPAVLKTARESPARGHCQDLVLGDAVASVVNAEHHEALHPRHRLGRAVALAGGGAGGRREGPQRSQVLGSPGPDLRPIDTSALRRFLRGCRAIPLPPQDADRRWGGSPTARRSPGRAPGIGHCP